MDTEALAVAEALATGWRLFPDGEAFCPVCVADVEAVQ